MTTDRLLRQARLYRLQPGDIVVIEAKDKLSEASLARLRENAVIAFGEQKVVILDGGLTTRILRPSTRTRR
jgi:regulator of RNase E activity RraA